MKSILRIDKEGKIFLDEIEIERKNLDGAFLESIFQKSLKNEIDYVIDDSNPISKLFLRIQEETSPTSDFTIKIKKLREELKLKKEEKNIIENSTEESSLPF
jgi:hypothetical protein